MATSVVRDAIVQNIFLTEPDKCLMINYIIYYQSLILCSIKLSHTLYKPALYPYLLLPRSRYN